MPPIITLLTDFGAAGTYPAQMKGVILGRCPDARIVDLCHEVPRHDVRTAAFMIASATRAFPEGTVHVAVVDPGVGTERRAVAVSIAARALVAPDNGLAAAVTPADRAVVLDWRKMGLGEPSATFHGRDLFAPAAARLAGGGSLDGLGDPVAPGALVACPLPEPRQSIDRVEGVVLASDHFGNLVTNVRDDLATGVREAVWASGRSARRVSTFAEAAPDEVVLLAGSAGYLELAVNGGSATEATGLERGDGVLLR